MFPLPSLFFFFFFNDTATTEIYTLSLHDALPISDPPRAGGRGHHRHRYDRHHSHGHDPCAPDSAKSRSEEHTSELQSLAYLVCRLLLEKKKIVPNHATIDRNVTTHIYLRSPTMLS